MNRLRSNIGLKFSLSSSTNIHGEIMGAYIQ